MYVNFCLLLKQHIFEAIRLGNAVSMQQRNYCKHVRKAGREKSPVGKSRLLVGESRLFNFTGFFQKAERAAFAQRQAKALQAPTGSLC